MLTLIAAGVTLAVLFAGAGAVLTAVGVTLAVLFDAAGAVLTAVRVTLAVLFAAAVAVLTAVGVTLAVLFAGAVLAALGAPAAWAGACTALGLDAAGVPFVAGEVTPSASFDAAVALLRTPSITVFVFWIICGFCAPARPAASTPTRIVIVRFIVSPYRFAGVPGLPAPAGSKSWLKYVVVTQVATTLSLGAY